MISKSTDDIYLKSGRDSGLGVADVNVTCWVIVVDTDQSDIRHGLGRLHPTNVVSRCIRGMIISDEVEWSLVCLKI